MYRSRDNPGVIYTAREYLDYKISQDDPWGIMLMQTISEAGVDSRKVQSHQELTGNGTRTPMLGGRPVCSTGIFEWLALMLQERPDELSP